MKKLKVGDHIIVSPYGNNPPRKFLCEVIEAGDGYVTFTIKKVLAGKGTEGRTHLWGIYSDMWEPAEYTKTRLWRIINGL